MAKAVIKTQVDANTRPFEQGLIRAGQSAERFKNTQIKQLGAAIGGIFAVRAVARFVGDIGKTSDKLQDMAANLNIGVEQLQALQVAAERGGSSAEELNGVLLRAARAGVGIETVAKAYLGLDNTLLSVQEAQTIAGRSGANLNAVFNQIANDGITNMTQSMLDANQIMTEDTVNAAGNMAKAYDRMATSIKNTLANLAVKAVETIKFAGAFWGAVAGGEGFSDAAATAMKTIREEMYKGIDPVKMGAAPQRAQARQRAQPEITVSAPQAADSLARIGGMVGPQTSMRRGAEERMLKIAQQQEKLQEEMAAALKNIEANTEE